MLARVGDFPLNDAVRLLTAAARDQHPDGLANRVLT
jgi:hypothetical protein